MCTPDDLPLVSDEPKQEKKAEPPKEEKKKPAFSRQEAENLTLFGDTLLQYIEIQRSEADLRSYWKSNQEQIDKIKAHMPDLYEIIVTKFKEAKANV